MLPDFAPTNHLSEDMYAIERRKKARETFANMVAGVDGHYFTRRMMSWFNEANMAALADVLDELTADEIAAFVIKIVNAAQS